MSSVSGPAHASSRPSRLELIASGLIAACALMLGGLHPIYNNDVYGHMAAGREIVELGHVPAVDHFSFIADAPLPWRNHNWLSCLVFYALYELGGPNALIALTLLVLALTGAFLVARAGLDGERGACALVALWVVLAVPLVRFRFNIRPHLFGLLAAALLFWALGKIAAQPRERPRWGLIAGLALVQGLWLNLHGSSLLGIAMTLGYLVVHVRVPPVRRELARLLIAQLLASCVSPWGPAILIEAVAHFGDARLGATLTEWTPFGADDPPAYMAALALLGIALVLVLRPLRRLGVAGLAAFGVGAVTWFIAMRSGRFLPDALLLNAPVVAIGASAFLRRVPGRMQLFAGALLLPAAAVSSAWASTRLPPRFGIGVGESTMLVPSASGAWLARHHPRARVAGAIQDTWYVSWAAPQSRVLVDGRVSVFGIERIREVGAAFSDPARMMALIDERRIDALVLRHTFLGAATAVATMRRQPGWKLVALEDHHALFVRRTVDPNGAAFEQLAPGYAREPPSRDAYLELTRLREAMTATGFYSYHRALWLLRDGLIARGRDGLAPPAGDGPLRAYREALALLQRSARRDLDVQLVHTHHALTAAVLCHLDEAEAALAAALALESGDNRDTLLIAQEIALRHGHAQRTRAFVKSARALLQGQPDPWIDRLAQAADHDLNPCAL